MSFSGGISNRRRIHFEVRSQCLTTLTEHETIGAKRDDLPGSQLEIILGKARTKSVAATIGTSGSLKSVFT